MLVKRKTWCLLLRVTRAVRHPLCLVLGCVFGCGVGVGAFAGDVTLTAPASVTAGAGVSVEWTGPNNPRDYITIVKPAAKPTAYNHYQYTRKGSPATITVPQVSGDYELRYNSEVDGTVLGRRPIAVVPAVVSITSPPFAKSGAEISVTWEGPNNQGDYITVVKKGAAAGTWTQYAYTYTGNPVQLRMPDTAGQYEIRYATEQARITLAANDILITASEATLRAPAKVSAGANIEIAWTGPNNPRDYITVVKQGAKEGAWKTYRYTAEGSPLMLTAPDDAGDYEIRYANGQSYSTLTSIPLSVVATRAQVEAPAEVVANDAFSVTWQGPDHEGDYITIVKKGAREGDWLSYTYTKRGSPLNIKAPKVPGEYEVRYSTGQTNKTLARQLVTVTEGNTPGFIQVTAAAAVGSAAGQEDTFALILDASGSMLKAQGDTRRIDIAKQAITHLVDQVMAENTPFSLRVFGHKEVDSCRTDLEIPLQPLNRRSVKQTLQGVTAKNLAKTPIAASLALIAEDTRGSKGPVTVILLTDGEETCEGDPLKAIESLTQAGMNVRVNIVGFAIDEYVVKARFTRWAQRGNGRYFEASNQAELIERLSNATEKNYQLVNSDGEVVASGLINGEAIAVPPGQYQLTSRYLPGDARPVVIKADVIETMRY